MSGVYPTIPCFSSMRFSSATPTLVSWSHSLLRQSRSRGSQRWLIEAEYPPNLTRAEIAPLVALSWTPIALFCQDILKKPCMLKCKS